MERILCVFEGEKAEKQYFESLRKVFFQKKSHESVFFLTSYQNDIYELYKELSADEDLDIVELVKELNPGANSQEELSSLDRDEINQVYLFFDLECHDDKFCPEKLINLLALFNEETDKGKLFISYPMVEAIRDINDEESYLNLSVTFRDCVKYKNLSASRGKHIYQQAKKLDYDNWCFLVTSNLKKANHLVLGTASLQPIHDQSLIARGQIQKHFPQMAVAVLSAFPIFIVDYFGAGWQRDTRI